MIIHFTLANEEQDLYFKTWLFYSIMSGYNDHWGSISKCGLILQLLIIRRSLFLMNQNNTALPIYSNQLTRMCWFFLLNQNHTVNQCSSSNTWTNDCSETVIFSELNIKTTSYVQLIPEWMTLMCWFFLVNRNYTANQCSPTSSWTKDSNELVLNESKPYSTTSVIQIIPKWITIMGWFVLIQLEFRKCWDVFLN